MKKLSIIMPAFNAQETIKRALESLYHQTYRVFEVIVINDASTDKTDDIVQLFCNTHPDMDIKYCKFDTNKGVSETRNTALGLVTGEYIVFLDSDDYFSEDALETIENEINKDLDTDMFLYEYISELEDGKVRYISGYTGGLTEFNSETFVQEMLLQKNRLYGHIGTKVIKKSALGEIEFDTTITFMEDVLFNIQVGIQCKKIKHIPMALYHYVYYITSLTHNGHVEVQIQKTALLQKRVKQILVENGLYEKERLNYFSFCNRTIFFAIEKTCIFNINDKEKCLLYLKMIWETFNLKEEFSQVPLSLYYNEHCCFLTNLLKQFNYDYECLYDYCLKIKEINTKK